LVSSLLLGSLQWFPALATSQVRNPGAHAIVILSGDEDSEAPEYGGPSAGPLTLERLEYGARLARELQLPILITGGKTPDADVPLALTMQDSLLRDFNLKPRWIEAKSRTTHENAIFSASILKAEGVDTVYLVTHAWHMPRAKAAFEAAGVAVIPGATRFVTAAVFELKKFLPTPRRPQNSYFPFFEWLGPES